MSSVSNCVFICKKNQHLILLQSIIVERFLSPSAILERDIGVGGVYVCLSNSGSRILVWEGHWQGVWDGSPPMGSRGRAPVRVGLRAKPPAERRMLRHEGKKPRTYREKKQVHTH